MQETFDWQWVQAQVARSVMAWDECGTGTFAGGRRYNAGEQEVREQAYDKELRAVEREVKRKPGTRAERLATRERVTAALCRFATAALNLEGAEVELLSDQFLPVGIQLARWARQFDEDLSMAEIVQAARNAWTACGLQPLLGERIALTPSILGYSLLYPYTDNYLDCADVSGEEKRRFSDRFRQRLCGAELAAERGRETALWALVELIEGQYARRDLPQVFDCLLAIHHAQEASLAQLRGGDFDADEVLRISCAKGGSSVLADACLARGWLMAEESEFAFDWGVLLQLGDDLQDVREDLERGSVTLFSRAAAAGESLDALTRQLLSFSEQVGRRMDGLSHGAEPFRNLLRMSWQSLILGAVADSHEYFSPAFLAEMERMSPFRFEFLRERRGRLTAREGFYSRVFEVFVAMPDESDFGPEFAVPPTVSILTTGTESLRT